MNGINHPGIYIVAADRIVACELRRVLDGFGHEVFGMSAALEDVLAPGRTVERSIIVIDLDDCDRNANAVFDRVGTRPLVALGSRTDEATLTWIATKVRPVGFVAKPFSDAQLVATISLAMHASATKPTADRGRAHRVGRESEALHRIARVLSVAGVSVTTSPKGSRLGHFEGAERLSERESEIVDALAAHRRVARVAAALSISEHTVRNHLKSIFGKLEVHSQDELLQLALGESWLAPRSRDA